MRTTKVLFAVLILPVLMIFGCNEKSNPTQPTAPNPVGTWIYSDGTIAAGYQIATNKTFDFALAFEGDSVNISEESGTWSISNNVITFTSTDCSEYDSTTAALEPVVCDNPISFTISGNTMTDGTATLTRQ